MPLVILLLAWMAIYFTWAEPWPPERELEVGYTHSEFDVLKPKPKPASQADALKDVWQLTDADISKPVVLW